MLEPDPALAAFRNPATGACWWCGDTATTEEHRIKATTLRRVARADGSEDPANVFKKSSDWEAPLRTLKKGAQVRWRKNLCARCNNARSQPFDRAYDVFEAHLVSHFDDLASVDRIDWREIYGDDWKTGAIDLARYFAKQLGCMMATYDLPVPDDVSAFLDGADSCPSVAFVLAIDPRVVAVMKQNLEGLDLSCYVGLLESQAYSSASRLAGVNYGFHIGYMTFSRLLAHRPGVHLVVRAGHDRARYVPRF